MMERLDIYAITGADAWANYGEPGPYRAGIDSTLSAIEQQYTKEIYKATSGTLLNVAIISSGPPRGSSVADTSTLATCHEFDWERYSGIAH